MRTTSVAILLAVCMYTLVTMATGTTYIGITVQNNFNQFKKTWWVGFDGKSLYDAMVVLQNQDQTFSFASEPYPGIGHFVVSMCHMVACNTNRQYWGVLTPDGKFTENGVDLTYPGNNAWYTFNLTTF